MLAKAVTTLFIVLGITLSGCSQQPKKTTPKTETTTDKHSLRMLSSDKKKKDTISTLRVGVLRDTALSVGARAGLAQRSNEINKMLVKHERSLSTAFNFQAMLLDDNILPPVLLESRKTLNLASADAIRIAERNYQILHQARFITNAPTARDYLWLPYQAPETPDKSLLPRNKAERVVWQKYIDEGWDAGILQAETIFRENINRLVRDFEGMIRYRTLLMQNMVSPPYVATLDLGITGNGNEMSINDKVLRITAFPALQTHADNWKTEITPYE